MINVEEYERMAGAAVRDFWAKRDVSGVTAGKNMDGFLSLVLAIVRANGLGRAEVYERRALLSLPGFFRPTKLWDFLVFYQGELIAAIELKSQVGPSFGNNFNNRTEEAIGTAYDFWAAYREGAFGVQPRPFVGWLMLVEDAPGSRSPVQEHSPHFPTLEKFKGTSYLQRYDLLCQSLVQQGLYTAASVIASPRSGAERGDFESLSSMTSLKTFVVSLAGHIAAQAARLE